MGLFPKSISAEEPGQTAEERIHDLHAFAESFNTHLCTVSGTILPSNIRLGVALCARDALLKCKHCHENVAERRSTMVCPMPNARFYNIYASQKHKPGFPTEGESGSKLSKEVEKCLVTIVHTLICHQERIDQLFYEDAVAALISCGILDQYDKSFEGECGRPMTKEDADLAARALYCEIILLSSISHALHVLFLSLGNDVNVPALPSWHEIKGAPPPSNIRYRLLLKGIQYNQEFAFSPFFVSSDIIRDGSECKKIPAETWAKLPYSPSPYRCTILAIEDFIFFQSFHAALYLPAKEMLLRWNELGPSKCSTVCRHDVETVAGATAKAHKCTY